MLVVDTCVLIDIADDDPTFGERSARCLEAHLASGLLLSPVSFIELAPVFDGSLRLLDEFLRGVGVTVADEFGEQERLAAFRGWAHHVSQKRTGNVKRRPVADALIGALALRHEGIITRNPRDFRSFYPTIAVVEP
ncbi:MAG: hypothetical protein KA712_18545 [Myxococcales bacterium]|nr:hypothetical protein [Myxococcales bacterium]